MVLHHPHWLSRCTMAQQHAVHPSTTPPPQQMTAIGELLGLDTCNLQALVKRNSATGISSRLDVSE